MSFWVSDIYFYNLLILSYNGMLFFLALYNYNGMLFFLALYNYNGMLFFLALYNYNGMLFFLALYNYNVWYKTSNQPTILATLKSVYFNKTAIKTRKERTKGKSRKK